MKKQKLKEIVMTCLMFQGKWQVIFYLCDIGHISSLHQIFHSSPDTELTEGMHFSTPLMLDVVMGLAKAKEM